MFAEAAGVAVTSMSNVDMKQDLLSHRDSFESDEELLVGDGKAHHTRNHVAYRPRGQSGRAAQSPEP